MITTADDVDLQLPSSGVKEILNDLPVEPLLPLSSQFKNDLVNPLRKPDPEPFASRRHSNVHAFADKDLPVDRSSFPCSVNHQNQCPFSDSVVGDEHVKNVQESLKDEPHAHHLLERYQAMNAAMVLCRTIPSSELGRNIETSPSHSIDSRAKNQAPSYGSAASKANSIHQHKLSEKRRRDAMGAFIQASEMMREDLSPSKLYGCSICQEDGDFFYNHITSFIIADSIGGSGGFGTKKTKNDVVADGLMWVFSVVLHLYPSEIGKRLHNIRACVIQMEKEKESGMLHDPKSKKWSADIRAHVLWKVLRAMESESEKHGVDIRNADDAPDLFQHCTTTPPSSISATSPNVGQKRSQDVSEESLEDEEPRTKLRGRPSPTYDFRRDVGAALASNGTNHGGEELP